MTCKPCQIAREVPSYNSHCPSCIYCGARLLQALGRLPIGTTECVQRRRAALAVWVEWGHDEQEIRALMKGPLAIGPEKDTGSDRQAATKRR